jgi:hypothetical protein
MIQSEYLPHVTKENQNNLVYVGDLNLVTLEWGIPYIATFGSTLG